MTGPLAQQIAQAERAMTCRSTSLIGAGYTHDPALCPGCRGRAALSAIERHVQDMDSKLRDIATREWRDEGGRIAAAIARDALGMKR